MLSRPHAPWKLWRRAWEETESHGGILKLCRTSTLHLYETSLHMSIMHNLMRSLGRMGGNNQGMNLQWRSYTCLSFPHLHSGGKRAWLYKTRVSFRMSFSSNPD